MQNTLAAILCLALAVGALFMWQPWADAAEVTPDARIPTPVASPDAAEPKLATAAQPRRTEVVAEPTTEAEPRGPVLRVIDGVTKEPVEHPTVRFLQANDLSDQEAEQLGASPGTRIFSVMEKRGRELRGDVAGEVRLPPITGECVISCRLEAKSGLMRPSKNSGSPLVLELHPDRSLKVLVQDDRGIPQRAIPVALLIELAPGFSRSLSQGETDGNGNITIKRWQQLGRLFGKDGEGVRVSVAIALPFVEQPRADIDVLAPPSGPVVLTLPPTGSVEVLLDHPDHSWLTGARVQISPTNVRRRGGYARHAEQIAENGRAVFERVGLGLKLQVSTKRQSGHVPAETEADGPVFSGQRVVVRVGMTSSKPVIVAELRDEKAQLLRSARLKTRIEAEKDGSRSLGSRTSRTDENGRIYIEVTDGLGLDATRSLQFVLEGNPTKMVKVTVPEVQPGENDLGVLTLNPPPLICSGTVTNQRGEPVAGATIKVYRKHVRSPGPDGFYWRSLRLPTIKTDPDGKFSVAAIVEQEDHALSISTPDYLPINLEPFGVGAAGLIFVMQSAASLSGKLVFDGEIVPRHWEVVVEHHEKGRANKEPSRGGEFRFKSLRPGMADVRVRMFGDPHPVFERAGVVLRAGEESELGEIDLQNRFHSITFHVQDNEGRAADGVAALVMHEGNQKFEGAFVDDGSATVMSRAETVNLVLYSESDPNYRSLRVDGVRDGQKIVMAKAHEVVVQLPPGVRLPGGGTTLGIRLWPRDANPQATRGPMSVKIRGRSQTSSSSGSGEPPWIQPGHDTFDGSGPAVVRVMSSGKYSVGLTLSNAEGRGVGVDGPEQTVEIPAGQDRISATATITQQALDEALAELRK